MRQAYFFNCDHIKSELVLLKTMALGLCLDLSLKNVLIITVPFLISWARYRGLEYIIKHYRWVFVCLFLMPISVVYDVYMFIRNWIVFKLNSAPKQHAKKVKDVQRQVSFLFLLDLCNDALLLVIFCNGIIYITNMLLFL